MKCKAKKKFYLITATIDNNGYLICKLRIAMQKNLKVPITNIA